MKWSLLIALIVVCLNSLGQDNRGDIVIDEIMADPSPQARSANGLPEVEFIELKNRSNKQYNLSGWKICDATGTAIVNTSFILQPDSFVIIASTNSASSLSSFGKTIGVANFPSLDNTGELLYLISKEGKIIHAIEYSSNWFQDPVKSAGGWTLEMIDPANFCSGASNWTSCETPVGGTPGKKNSVDAVNQDKTSPLLLRSYASDSLNIVLVFDEPLDSMSAANPANYNVSTELGNIVSALTLGPVFDKVSLRLQYVLHKNIVYSIAARNLSDCAGNRLQSTIAKLGLADTAGLSELVINELLFNPKPDGVDYIELYNRSNKILDLRYLNIGNRAGNGSISSLKQLTPGTHLIFPGEYALLSENADLVSRNYTIKNRDVYIELASLPSYPDDNGTVVVLSSAGVLIDEVKYSEKWHFKLIDNFEGIALERISFEQSSSDPSNWHSASASSGYGTPGYQNSQFMPALSTTENITVTPQTFSPDNDGFNDFTTVNLKFPEPGWVCNISIYDIGGRLVKRLVQNGLCGITGYFHWDGLDEKNNKLPIGIYVMITEVFNLNGKTKKFKNGVVLARRLG